MGREKLKINFKNVSVCNSKMDIRVQPSCGTEGKEQTPQWGRGGDHQGRLTKLADINAEDNEY